MLALCIISHDLLIAIVASTNNKLTRFGFPQVLNFVVLNLVLTNLLIAMMSSTYADAKEVASGRRLRFIFELAEEQTRRAISGVFRVRAAK